jgi:hypothetical protein
MDIFVFILQHNIAPVFIIIALGFAVGKKFDLNIHTMSKLNFYLFVPAFIFVNLYTADLNMGMLKIVLLCILYQAACDLIARVVSKVRGFDAGLTNAFKNSIMFNNTGNIGLSLITLVFGSAPYIVGGGTPYLSEAVLALIAILVFMNVTMNTIWLYNAGRAKAGMKEAAAKIFMMPSIYVIPVVLILKQLGFDMTPTLLWPALVYLKEGLVPIALLTLGVQLSKTKLDFRNTNVHISVFTRLIFGPALALGFIFLFGFTGVTAQTILIAYSVPTAVNTALLAVECRNNEEFATQAVVISTIFSAVTLSGVIYLARVAFPV